MSSAHRAIDEELALQRAGGNVDLARELYRMLQKELPDYQSRLPGLYARGDMQALQEAVHKLNGSATYCGVPALKAAVDAMESRIKRGEEERYAEGMKVVMQEIERLIGCPSLPI